jgi:hypothetical protein
MSSKSSRPGESKAPPGAKGRINLIPFVSAGERVRRTLSNVVQPWFARLRANTDETKTLAALCDTLLAKLISSELQVKDAEHALTDTLV